MSKGVSLDMKSFKGSVYLSSWIQIGGRRQKRGDTDLSLPFNVDPDAEICTADTLEM